MSFVILHYVLLCQDGYSLDNAVNITCTRQRECMQEREIMMVNTCNVNITIIIRVPLGYFCDDASNFLIC